MEFIDAREPQLITYGFYIDEDAGKMTVVAVHPDSASLELHMNIGGEEFRKLGHLLRLTGIECYGRPSERALDQLRRESRFARNRRHDAGHRYLRAGIRSIGAIEADGSGATAEGPLGTRTIRSCAVSGPDSSAHDASAVRRRVVSIASELTGEIEPEAEPFRRMPPQANGTRRG